MWIALQAWLSKGGLERQEVPNYNSEIIQLVCSGGEETFATREVQLDGDPVLQARLFQQFLHFNILLQEGCKVQPYGWTRDGGGGGAPLLHSNPRQVLPPSSYLIFFKSFDQVSPHSPLCLWGMEPNWFR